MNTIDPAAYTGDIVSRLRNWRGLHLAHSGNLFEEAADEIARLRLTDEERQAVTTAINYYGEDNAYPECAKIEATLWGLLERVSLQSESPAISEKPALTAAEREAVRFCVTASLPETEKLGGVAGELCRMHKGTFRSLLERLGDTPAAHATPREGSEQDGCTLAAEEREAVKYYVGTGGPDSVDATLVALLERMA